MANERATVRAQALTSSWARSFIQSIAYGHCGFLVDFPSNDARNLREERELNAKPYFIMEQAPNIIGWRHDPADNQGGLQQVRLREFITEPEGRFGNKIKRQIRVMEPGKLRSLERVGVRQQ